MYGVYQCATNQDNDANFEESDTQAGLRTSRALWVRICHFLVVLEGLKASADASSVICIFQCTSDLRGELQPPGGAYPGHAECSER